MAVVFLSSTFAEMQEYRQAALAAIDACGHQCIHMEVFPAADLAIESFCAEKVKECDLFVLLLGKFYGTPIPGKEISYTEDEFDTALSLRKPRLVFIPGPGASLNTDAALARIDANGLSYDDQKRRQSAFAKKAVQGVLPRDFANPSDLKFQIGNSISQHFQAAIPTAAAPKRYAGEMLPLLCDRRKQFDEFGETFQTGKPGQPEIYVLPGHELEQHKNCVRRLTCYHITYPMKTMAGSILAPPPDRSVVEWPDSDEDDNDPKILFNRLRRGLFQALNPFYGFPQMSAVEAFGQLAIETKASHLLFRHIIRVENWNPAAQSLCMSQYLPFWSEVGKWFSARPPDQPRPRILVFFEFKHRFPDEAEEKSFRQSLCESFEKQRPEGVICQVLPPLSQVRLADLDNWYERYEKFLLPQHQHCETSQLFPEVPLRMIQVEKRLRDLLGLEANAS